MSTDQEIEKEITDKGLNAPRVTLESIESRIQDERYLVVVNTTVTICTITMENGFTVVGHSAAASPENFDKEIGRKIARQKAIDQLWALEGYLLREQLSKEGK